MNRDKLARVIFEHQEQRFPELVRRGWDDPRLEPSRQRAYGFADAIIEAETPKPDEFGGAHARWAFRQGLSAERLAEMGIGEMGFAEVEL